MKSSVNAHWVNEPWDEEEVMTLEGRETVTDFYSSIWEVPGDAPAAVGAWSLMQPGKGLGGASGQESTVLNVRG